MARLQVLSLASCTHRSMACDLLENTFLSICSSIHSRRSWSMVMVILGFAIGFGGSMIEWY